MLNNTVIDRIPDSKSGVIKSAQKLFLYTFRIKIFLKYSKTFEIMFQDVVSDA